MLGVVLCLVCVLVGTNIFPPTSSSRVSAEPVEYIEHTSPYSTGPYAERDAARGGAWSVEGVPWRVPGAWAYGTWMTVCAKASHCSLMKVIHTEPG